MFNGDWHLVLAAYNGGLGRVQRAMKRSGTDDFWALSESTRYLPKETREYVPLILAAIIVGEEPGAVRLRHRGADPIAYDKVTMPRAIDLRRVAEWTGTSVDEIQALNPELRRWTTPVRYPEYEMKVPAGTGDRLEARLADASPADLSAFKWYTVRSGETLPTIARKLRVSRADLAEANNLSVKSRVRAGQELIIPRAPATLLAARTERAAPADVASRAITGAATVSAAVEPGAERDRLPGQARRHALVHRAAVRHDGRQDQDPEQAARQRHRRRRPAEDRSLAARPARGFRL